MVGMLVSTLVLRRCAQKPSAMVTALIGISWSLACVELAVWTMPWSFQAAVCASREMAQIGTTRAIDGRSMMIAYAAARTAGNPVEDVTNCRRLLSSKLVL